MEVFKTIKSLQQSLERLNQNKTVGLVPTMGALHEGHLSIIDKAKNENDIVIASIFVNPTQFDKKEDLIHYPSTLESDLEALEKRGCDFVFTPTIEEIYQGNTVAESFDFKGLDKEMEGKFRTGHFNGVATIVKKLFMITSPNKAYFGEKDFQQLQIIKQMVKTEGLTVNIIPVEIYREIDGLAMSSRNTRLNEEQRKAAPEIYQTLLKGKKLFQQGDLEKVKSFVKNELIQNKELDLEYFEIADNENLKPATELDPTVSYRAFIAVFAGDIRLIDNIALN
ncbi:pantoate--beta-alanine ligase [Lutimonas zeaxanthinifaciens]|uniref:pantoate--beta-alanine ligase n=1 Tax=Lutimonas zeaxanthinifaciens TaxID=3060215 RepID=UPI00265D40EE|nr:pantoate--beta-alanine ligase [Lutimonas sp. YSD2104]WKK66240.1 pantoate--beta-alanine ligase [Lutimonas sp. YSD2104]